MPVTDNWMFIDNSGEDYEIIAEGELDTIIVNNKLVWGQIKREYHEG